MGVCTVCTVRNLGVFQILFKILFGRQKLINGNLDNSSVSHYYYIRNRTVLNLFKIKIFFSYHAGLRRDSHGSRDVAHMKENFNSPISQTFKSET